MSWGYSPRRRAWNTSQQQSQIVLLVPHQDWTKQGGRRYHSTWSLGGFWAPVPWVLLQGLATLLWDFVDTWYNQYSWYLFLNLEQKCLGIRGWWISQLCICYEVSCHEPFRKIPSQLHTYGIVFFQSLPHIHDHIWGFNKNKVFAFLRAPVLQPQSNEAHTELHSLCQSMYQSPCSIVCHSWIPAQGTELPCPAAMYYHYLLCTLPWFCGVK